MVQRFPHFLEIGSFLSQILPPIVEIQQGVLQYLLLSPQRQRSKANQQSQGTHPKRGEVVLFIGSSLVLFQKFSHRAKRSGFSVCGERICGGKGDEPRITPVSR